MNYSKIITYDACNSHGYSVTLWVCGCENQCEGCFNKELWDYNNGKVFTKETYNIIIKNLSQPHIKNFVILGGEPMSKKNRDEVIQLLKQVKTELPHIKTIVYTGFTIEELQLDKEELNVINIIIDSKFDKNLMPPRPQLRGSLNQKCYKVEKDLNNIPYLTDITNEYFGG